MTLKFLPAAIIVLFFVLPGFSQNSAENLLEKIELNFSLTGEPAPEDVGFEHPKSLWKLEYELRLTDSETLEKLGRCFRNEAKQFVCPIIRDKKLSKRIRRSSIRLAKGKFTRRPLSAAANREIAVPVQLAPEVIRIFNEARETVEKNPTFALFVKTKILTRTVSKEKFKQKSTVEGFNPLKTYVVRSENGQPEKPFDYWNVTKLFVNFTISRGEDGKFSDIRVFKN